jgi:hypothetical protein
MQQPVIETRPGTLDMSAQEASFGVPSVESQIDVIGMGATANHAEEDFQPVAGFDPVLLATFLRAAPGSEFAKNIEKAMIADFVVNNAVAYNLIPSHYEQTMINKQHEDKEAKEKFGVTA